MQEKINQQPIENIQILTPESREDRPCIEIVTRSRAATRNLKSNGKKKVETTWVRKTTKKNSTLDILKEKKVFSEARSIFMDDGALISTVLTTHKDNCKIVSVVAQDVDLNILNYFLHTHM